MLVADDAGLPHQVASVQAGEIFGELRGDRVVQAEKGHVGDLLELLALHGAPPQILTDARPHIGSNKLPKVITAMRTHLEERGVELQPMITAAEARDDRDGRTALLAEKQKLSEEVRRMKQELRRPGESPG
mgnify:CR=1 FL=1